MLASRYEQILGYSLLAGLLFSCQLLASDVNNPLAPVDTSSPRATLKSFFDAVVESGHLLQQLSSSRDGALALELHEAIERATSTLDLSEVPPGWLDDAAGESVLQLQEVLDRIPLPPLNSVPDAETAKAESMTSWTLPDTEIVIARVQQGPEAGNWLFSPDTVARTEEFYTKVEDLPYRADALVGQIGSLGGTFDYYRNFPEFDSIIPLELTFGLPKWAWFTLTGQPAWKWMGSVAVLAVALIVLFVVRRLSARAVSAAQPTSVGRYLWKVVFPVAGVLVVGLAEHAIDEEIGLTGRTVSVIETATGALSLFFVAWAIFALGNVVASTVNTSKRVDPDGVYAGLIRISAQILSFLIALWIVVAGIEQFGVSVVPLLAGLGIGGVAIALAVRPTLENMIGGFILFIDRPVGVGEFCRFGDQIGIVEDVGLRSTRVRTLQDTIVTVPNAEFSQLQLENFTRRRQSLLQYTLGLRYETTPEQMRYVLATLRELLLRHPMVSPVDLRVRFRGFGDYSLDIEVFAYIRTAGWHEFFAIREDVNLRIMDAVKEAGAEFAFPSQTTYIAKDRPTDDQAAQLSEAQVARWRKEGNLPFPEFGLTQQWQVEDTLDYPPVGSPDHNPAPKGDQSVPKPAPNSDHR